MATRLPSLNGLRAFETAARHLSFTAAAAELNVTQTAISHQIRRLEEELGIKLFVRQNRSLTLTPVAREYLPGIRAAFNDLRLATDRLLRKDGDRVLTVSTLASSQRNGCCRGCRPSSRPIPRSTSASPPRPAWSISAATTSTPQFRYGRGHWSGLRADWLTADELFPVCSPELLKGDKPLRSPEDLAHHTLLHSQRRL